MNVIVNSSEQSLNTDEQRLAKSGLLLCRLVAVMQTWIPPVFVKNVFKVRVYNL